MVDVKDRNGIVLIKDTTPADPLIAVNERLAAVETKADTISTATLPPLQTQVETIATQIGQTPSFVTTGIVTVAEALTTWAPNATRRGKYIRVSDLYGSVDGVMRCGYDGTAYFWQPTSTDFGKSVAMTGDMTVKAHTHPTSLALTGSIGVGITRTVTLDPADAWPGAIKELKSSLSSMLGGLNIGVLGLGTVVGMVLGGYQKYVCDRSGGSLTWIRLV